MLKHVDSLVEEISKIYHLNYKDAEIYLSKARNLINYPGIGFAIAYCWFYSVPQRWIVVEDKVFSLARYTENFNLNRLLSLSNKDLASILKPMRFYNSIAVQFKNFIRVIELLGSWESFFDRLCKKEIIDLFIELRKFRNIRITFKNLSAMKSFICKNDNFIILDTHVGRFLGLNKYEIVKYNTNSQKFEELMRYTNYITNLLRKNISKISAIKWSLSIWFYKSKIPANRLLNFRKIKHYSD